MTKSEWTLKRYDNIPGEMIRLAQWVCVSSDSKVPKMPWQPRAASTSDPNTWSSFSEVTRAVEAGFYSGIGFVFNNNGIVGIDIDTGYDTTGFVLSDLASDIIDTCKSYTERSRSGRGFHILIRGHLPFSGRNNRAGVEIYQSSRYFIMTGDVVFYDALASNQNAIDRILEKYFPDTQRESDGTADRERIYNPVWERPQSRIQLRPTYPSIPEGSRNICLLSLAGMLYSQGYSIPYIMEELRYCNSTACTPPLSDWEILQITRSISRYKR